MVDFLLGVVIVRLRRQTDGQAGIESVAVDCGKVSKRRMTEPTMGTR